MALILLGALLMFGAFRSPLTFYSMFDFGVFAAIAGLCLLFSAPKIEAADEAGLRPLVSPQIMASDQEN